MINNQNSSCFQIIYHFLTCLDLKLESATQMIICDLVNSHLYFQADANTEFRVFNVYKVWMQVYMSIIYIYINSTVLHHRNEFID